MSHSTQGAWQFLLFMSDIGVSANFCKSIQARRLTDARLPAHRKRRTGTSVGSAAENGSRSQFRLVERDPLGIAAHHAVEADRRLKPDAKARLHKLQLILGVR